MLPELFVLFSELGDLDFKGSCVRSRFIGEVRSFRYQLLLEALDPFVEGNICLFHPEVLKFIEVSTVLGFFQ